MCFFFWPLVSPLPMSLAVQRASLSTVEFTYSAHPRCSTSIPSIPVLIDVTVALFQSASALLFAQWASAQLATNKVLGPLLRSLRYLLPYNDARIVKFVDNTWQATRLGVIGIFLLAVFLFFSKSMPIGSSRRQPSIRWQQRNLS